MKKQKNWGSLYDAFDAMNSVSSCLVLRNYEDMTNDKYYMEGHDDIDFLCDNQKAVIKVLDAKRNHFWGSQDHYIVKIADKNVKFGLRYIGDGYYDAKWEKEILNRKVFHKNHYYIMETEDYFYTLLYHSLLQKKSISEDYSIRLRNMGKNLGYELDKKIDFEDCLYSYLKSNHYYVDYPRDITVPTNYNYVPKELLRGKILWNIKLFFYIPRKYLGKIIQMFINIV